MLYINSFWLTKSEETWKYITQYYIIIDKVLRIIFFKNVKLWNLQPQNLSVLSYCTKKKLHVLHNKSFVKFTSECIEISGTFFQVQNVFKNLPDKCDVEVKQ